MTSPIQRSGAAYDANQTAIVEVVEDNSTYVCTSTVDSVAVNAAGVTVKLCDVKAQPRLNDRHKIAAVGGDVQVDGGLFPILGGGNLVPQGSATYYFLVPNVTGGPVPLAWVGIGNAGALGVGEIFVKNIAALVALKTAALPDKIDARVLTFDQPCELDKTSTALADGITIFYTAESQQGALPGRWLRRETFNKRWALQGFSTSNTSPTWSIDPLNGDDENTGSSPTVTPGSTVGPIKTVAEVCRRLHQAQTGRNYFFQLLNDVPNVEAAPRPFGMAGSNISDRFRPNWINEANAEDINSSGFEQVISATLSGVAPGSGTVVASGSLGVGGYVASLNAIGQQAKIDLGVGFPVASYLGNFILITSGANAGAIGGIGFDLGGGVAQISELRSPANAVVGSFPQGAPAVTFQIVQMTKWEQSIILMVNSQSRILIQNLDMPAPASPPPADQEIITSRFSNITWSRVRFQRPVDWSVGTGHAANVCIFDYLAAPAWILNTDGLVNVDAFQGAIAFNSCLFLKADLRMTFLSNWLVSGCYSEQSRWQTYTPTNFTTYGFFNVSAGTAQAVLAVFGTGLGIYNWPVNATTDAGLRLVDGSLCYFAGNSNLYGASQTVNAVGLRVDGGSKFLTGPTDPIITAPNGLDLQLEHGPTAMQPLPAWAGVAQANYPRPVSLGTWADWKGAIALDPGVGPSGANFARHAMSYTTGACISQRSV